MRPYCSPTVANCWMLLSIWGIFQLAVLGLLFQRDSIGLFHDYEPGKGPEIAMNCFVTAGIFVGTLLLSVYSLSMNNRQEKNLLYDENDGRDDNL